MAKNATKTAKIAENRKYFLTFLVATTFTETEVNSIKEAVTKLVTKYQGQILTLDDWGKRGMAYKIKHNGKWQVEARYFHVVFEMSADQVQTLERDVHLNQSLLRHLLVLADEAGETQVVEAQA